MIRGKVIKGHFIILMLLLIGLCVSCNSRRPHLEPYHWETIDNEFDSISLILESEVLAENNLHETPRHLFQLDSIYSLKSSKNPDKKLGAMNARITFWKTILMTMEPNPNRDSLSRMLNAAIKELDTISYPYHYHRLLDENIILSYNSSHSNIQPLLRSSDFYKEIGDSRMYANSLIGIGNLMDYASQPILALRFHEMADSIYKEQGFILNVRKNQINITNDLIKLGREKEAYTILKSLKNDTILSKNFEAKAIVGILLYKVTKDGDYLIDVYSKEKGKNDEVDTYIEVLLSEYYRNRTSDKLDLDSASLFSKSAFKNLSKIKRLEWRKLIWAEEAKRFERERKYDSAYWALDNFYQEDLESISTLRTEQITSSHYFHDVTQLQVEKEKADIRTNYSILISFLSVIILLIIVIYIVSNYRKNKKIEIEKYKSEKIKAELETLKSKREIVALTLASQESEKRISAIKDNIDNIISEKSLVPTELRQIKNELIQLTDAKSEWDNVIELIKQGHPNFIPNLYKACPTISSSQVKLAALIFIGLSINQIASYLNVKTESVMQSRWRLKNKLGLSNEESLESALMKLNEEGNF